MKLFMLATIVVASCVQHSSAVICNACGAEGCTVSNPAIVIDLPVESPLPSATCQQILEVSIGALGSPADGSGILTAEQCAAVAGQDAIRDACGCTCPSEPTTAVAAPTPAPVAPTPAPVVPATPGTKSSA